MQTGGGTPAGGVAAATRLIQQGATALVSFGLAGGLDPSLRPGTLIVASHVLSDGEALPADGALAALFGGASGHTILAGTRVVADAIAKQRLFAATGAHAVDLESGPVGRIAIAHGLPFAAVRAICDPAKRTLPPAALVALNPAGRIGPMHLIRSIVQQPRQIGGLLALAWDAARARRVLISLTKRMV